MRFVEHIKSASDTIGLWPSRAVVWLAVYGFFLIPVTEMLKPDWDLTRHGVRTQGIVVALTPKNHATVRYGFRVGGLSFEGSDQPPFAVAVGDSLPITYLPGAPTTSVAGEPSIDGWWFLPFVLLPGVATMAAMAIQRGERPREPVA